MNYKVTITTEMTTGHKFTDTMYLESFDDEFFFDYIAGKAVIRGFKVNEIDKYEINIIAE